jgi:4-hydroxybenzoate polyprenyltransferase
MKMHVSAGGEMDKKMKSTIKKEKKISFSMEPGLTLLLIFMLYTGTLLFFIHYLPRSGWLGVFFPIIVIAIVLYSKGSLFGIKNEEEAKKLAKELFILGVILTIIGFFGTD